MRNLDAPEATTNSILAREVVANGEDIDPGTLKLLLDLRDQLLLVIKTRKEIEAPTIFIDPIIDTSKCFNALVSGILLKDDQSSEGRKKNQIYLDQITEFLAAGLILSYGMNSAMFGTEPPSITQTFSKIFSRGLLQAIEHAAQKRKGK